MNKTITRLFSGTLKVIGNNSGAIALGGIFLTLLILLIINAPASKDNPPEEIPVSETALKNLTSCERQKLLEKTKSGRPIINSDIGLATEECNSDSKKDVEARIAAQQSKILDDPKATINFGAQEK